MENPKTMRAVALLVGTVIGAGVLGIPYAITKSGFLTGLVTIIILALAILMLNLFFGEITLRTPGKHQIPGYAEKYLGKYGKIIAMVGLFFGIYGALTAYMIGEGEALSAIFGLNPFIFSIMFLLLTSIFVYRGLKTITESELVVASIVIGLALLVSLFAFFSGKLDISNLATFNPQNILLPYGVILFALHGSAAIPEMREYLARDKKRLKKAIIIGSVIPAIIYIIFAAAVVGVTGIDTTEVATIGLGNYFGGSMIVLGNLFAIFAMFTSFLVLALAMKESYMYDYKIKPFLSWLLTISIPLIVFLVGMKSFATVLSIGGAFGAGITGILIVLMFWKARKHGNRVPEYKLGKKFFMGVLIIVLLILGIIYQFL
jgi:tyrosine-specific transport protein